MRLRHIIFLLLGFVLCPARMAAQQESGTFTELAAEDFAVSDDEVPFFSTLLPLDDGQRADDIALEFPELTPLTKDEVRRLRALGFEPAAMPAVTRTECVMRKRRMAEVSFAPFVVRGGRWYRIASVKVALPRPTLASRAATPQTAASQGSRYAAHSALATGKWVKLRVSEEGVYELTQSRLSELGFTDMSRVKLYGYGGRLLPQTFSFAGPDALVDDLREVPLYRKQGSVLFFAEGTLTRKAGEHQNNLYSDHSYYFLTEGDSPAVPETADVPAAGAYETATTPYLAVLDNDSYGWYEGGTEMYDAYDFAAGQQHSYRLAAPQADTTRTATVTIAFAAASTVSSTTASVRLNGSQLGSLTVGTYSTETESARERRSSFTAKVRTDNTFAFTTNNPNNARLNFIRILYTRKLDAAAAPYAFTPGTDGRAATLLIAGATASTQLWLLPDGEQPGRLVPARLDGTTLHATIADDTRRYAIVDVAKTYAAPTVVGSVANQDLHADGAQDMVIVIPQSDKLRTEAERLAEAHRAEGLRVRVVRADEIYNEFSSGTPDATAIRRYMKMLYDHAESDADMPRYLLLFGDCTWDYRMRTSSWHGQRAEDYLPAFEMSQTRYQNNSVGTLYSYVTDDYFGLLDDGEGAAIEGSDRVDIGIGRFPCHDAETAGILVQKTLDYMANRQTGMWKNRIVMAADYGDSNLHMRDTEDVVSAIRNSTGDKFTLEKVYLDAYTRTSSATGFRIPQATAQLKKLMNEGALIFNYTGHGSPRELSHVRVLLPEDFSAAAQGNMPVWVFAACEITPYDQATDDLGRLALFNPTGGAVAVVCASRTVYANYNKSINQALSRRMLTPGNTLGDAVRLAKGDLASSQSQLAINCRKYALLGDPALALLRPTGNIVVDSIDGTPLVTGSSVRIKAGSVVRFSGYVCDAAGRPDTAFDGEVTGSLYDRTETVTCKNNAADPVDAFTYTDRTKRLYQGSDSVRAGRFSLVAVVPREISYSTDAGRLVLYAANNERTLERHGFNEQFHFNGSEAGSTADSIGPSLYVWLNTTDFPNGGYVGTEALFGAMVSDSAGINVSGTGIGHDMELVLDGDVLAPIVLNDYFSFDFGSYTQGSVSYRLEGLAPGRHTLTMRAWDMNDNASAASLDFIVREGYTDAFGISATRNPASTATTFITTLEAPEQGSTVRTEVYDTYGRLVWRHEGSTDTGYHSAPWDLRDSAGRPVAAGVYLYRSVVRSAQGKRETKTKKMIVVKQ